MAYLPFWEGGKRGSKNMKTSKIYCWDGVAPNFYLDLEKELSPSPEKCSDSGERSEIVFIMLKKFFGGRWY